MTVLPINVINTVKPKLVRLLTTSGISWANERTVYEVVEFDLHPQRRAESLQLVFSAHSSGQGGGSYIVDLVVEMGMIRRFSLDSERRVDKLLDSMRNDLAMAHSALEGQSLGELEIPLYSNIGPTRPEVLDMNTSPVYGFAYVQFSGQKVMTLADAVGKPFPLIQGYQ